ncbi:LamG domain-containing protein, partial [Bacteroidales bacterium OttesenSCG-928-A17]|nr:LamG domain-containing protein [Bacteroidales bacterium OttesenSCG-928-A17]
EKDWTRDSEDYEMGGGEGAVDEGSIEAKTTYSSFIFKTRAGVTSCPYEGEYRTKYYEKGQHILNYATRRLEVPEIDMPVKFIENVPSGETAKLQLYLRNNSEVQEDVWFDLKVIDASNPNGARMQIDGGAIGNGRNFLVPAGETLIKTLEVGKGSVMNYDNLQLILQSQCQYDPTNFLENIADTVTFTVHFTPSCTDLVIKKPSNNWTYNTKMPTVQVNGVDKRYMDVVIDKFNVNYDNFDHIELQYKSASQSDNDWITLKLYYNDSTLFKKAINNGFDAEMIDASNAGTIPYRFFMDDMADQYYDIRAVSVCNINNELIYNESPVSTGIKDTYRPRLFGSAQPASGILTINDDVRLNFNERIAEGLLTRHNFQVRTVRNGSVSDHSVSIHMDGVNDYMATEFEKNLEGKDITVEMWVQADQPQNATLFSHGNRNESLELAITSDNRLQVTIGSAVLTSLDPVPYDQGSWAHISMVYEASGYLTAYYNYSPVINRTSQAGAYSGIGNFVLGKSISKDGNNYAGKIHNVRVWEKSIPSTTIQVNSLVQLSGNEAALVAYYPMNEGKGTLCEDKARGATMIMEGCGWVMPDGFAIATNETNYLQIEAGSAAITKEMDYTIEFWFKAEPGQVNATLFSNGVGDGRDFGGSTYTFAIGFDENGMLSFINNENKTIIEGEYRDNNWHHFALSVNRVYSRAQIYMDGNLNTYIDASYLGGISSAYMFLGARGWYSENAPNTLIVDNHFKGVIDDLRFWELYKDERMVSENNNVKLTGEELGLIHYYPFDTYIEHQGMKFIEFTNKDMRIASGPNPEKDEFTVIGSEEQVKSKEIAPLKDFGPLADLEFDFVVNNDALIINLLEPEYKIAKTIVTFTVMDVRDVNGNSIASPITWSAYIDKNQLKWSEDILNLTKNVYAEMEFTVRAINNGGSIQKYRISNMPSWLDVTPSSGTLTPTAYQEITFTVNEGLNVGTYNEVIYLTNEENVSEALTINLTVMGEKPEWTVNPADFKYNMSVFGKMRFNNIFSTDKGDMLAAFKDGDCVGVTTSIYDKRFDMWYALLTVYGNEKSYAGLEFRMWDASTGKTYKATPDT